MRFKATLNNPVGLYKIVQALEKLSGTCIVSFTMDDIRFTTYKDDESAIPAWVKMKPQSIFTNYRVESRHNNEINFVIRTRDLHVATRALHDSTGINVQLKTRNNKQYLEFLSSSMNASSTTTDETTEVEVSLVPSDKMVNIKEPQPLGVPDTYIFLPSVSVLKPYAERFKAISKFMLLSATMNGKFKLEVESSHAICKVSYDKLHHPQLSGQHEATRTRELDQFSSVRLRSEDFVKFLSCYYLNPSNVICSISDELQLAFYVYLTIDDHQNQDAPIRPFHPSQTTLTCHLPVYND